MFRIQLRKGVEKFIESLPPKHKRQVKDYILNLARDPNPQDSKVLKGYEPYLRGDVGEYRVIYTYSESEQFVNIALVGKRNGGEVYKKMERML